MEEDKLPLVALRFTVLKHISKGAETWLFFKRGVSDHFPLFFKRALAIAVIPFFMGCAKESTDIAAVNVSPVPYQKLTCDELQTEYLRANQQALQTFKNQDKIAGNDSTAMAIGMILF